MRRLVVLVVALFVVSLGFGLAPAAAQTDPGSAEAAFVVSINTLRADKGLGPLTVHAELVGIARSWAATMAEADRISHNAGLAGAVQADWQKLGENVGVGMTVEKLHRAFIDSPTHYKNLVDPAFTHVGVGVVIGREGAIFTAHQFMQLRAGRVAPAPVPPPAPPETEPPAPPLPAPETEPPPAPPLPAPVAVAVATSPAGPSVRVVLVLEQLRALDRR